MTTERKSFEQGDEVLVMEEGREVSGRVESVQLKPAVKIDVRLNDPGHRRHGLIIAFNPDEVSLADEAGSRGPTSYEALQRRVEGERTSRSNQELLEVIKGMATQESAALSKINLSVADLVARVVVLETLPSALSALQARVDALEAKVVLLENPASPTVEGKSESA
jgi:hypothetical protein